MAKKDKPIDFFALASDRLKTRIKEPNINRYSPHAKQKKFHESPAKVRLFIGGNRSGKTHSGVAEDIYWLRGNHPYRKIPDKKISGRVVGVDFIESVFGILIPKFKSLIPPSLLINGSWEDSFSKELRLLTCANGNELQFLSYDQDTDKHAGTSKDFIHMDEEPPQSIFNENRARVVDVNGEMWLTMTPLDGFTWSYDGLYLPGLDPDKPNYFTLEVDMLDNPIITKEAAENFLSSLDPEERKAREHGQFMSVGGRVYKNFSPLTHRIDHNYRDIKQKLHEGWTLYETLDHGWNNPTAWLWAIVSPEGQDPKIIVIDEHYASGMLVSDHARIVHEKRQMYGTPFLSTGDPALKQTNAITGTSVLQEYANHGIYLALEGVPAGRGSVGIGVEKVHQYLANNPNTDTPYCQIMDNCPNLIKELQMLRWKTYTTGKQRDANNKFEEIQKKDDHAADAFRYFVTLMPDLQQALDEQSNIDPKTGWRKIKEPPQNIDRLLASMSGPEDEYGNEYYAIPDTIWS